MQIISKENWGIYLNIKKWFNTKSITKGIDISQLSQGQAIRKTYQKNYVQLKTKILKQMKAKTDRIRDLQIHNYCQEC